GFLYCAASSAFRGRLDAMRLKKQGWAGLAMLAAFCALGVAAAQPAAAPAQPSTEVGAQREVALTPQQMLDESNKYLPEMDRGAIQVRRQLEQAREARDVVKV